MVELVAAVWTWLEPHLLILGSLRDKAPNIRAAAAQRPFASLEPHLDEIGDSPVRGAAILLAALHERLLGDGPGPLAAWATGINGEEVLVAWRQPSLALRLGRDDPHPPPAQEHPALAALAPNLSVCPSTVGGIGLELISLPGEYHSHLEAELAAARFEQPGLTVHMDTLGDAGRPTLSAEPELTADVRSAVATLTIDSDTDADVALRAAVGEAVKEASGHETSILLLPELALSPAGLDELKRALQDRAESDDDSGSPPILTVAGLLHFEPPDEEDPGELVGNADVARHVNEAVVLSFDGEELWRHRKLSSAQVTQGDPPTTLVEDIRLGDRLAVLPTGVGTLSVVICLDSFAAHVRDRIAMSPADTLLIPSYSEKVHRHRASLQHLVQKTWGIAFVCNRFFDASGEPRWSQPDVASFCTVQRRKQLEARRHESGHPSFVVSTSS